MQLGLNSTPLVVAIASFACTWVLILRLLHFYGSLKFSSTLDPARISWFTSSTQKLARPHVDVVLNESLWAIHGVQSPLIQPSSAPSSNLTFWEAIVRDSLSASRIRLQRLYDSACITYHGPPRGMATAAPFTFEGLARDNLPVVTTREDLCQRGRWDVISEHTSQEVIILPQLKLIYVIGKKCGSTTIRHFFQEFWGVSFVRGLMEEHICASRQPVQRTCETLSLDDEIVNNYLIFGLTRDPISRFYSALKEANQQAELYGRPIPYQNRDDILHLLETQMGKNGTCGYDRHLESQLTELFTPFASRRHRRGDGGDRMLPLDFLGSMDSLAEDVVTALLLAGQRAGKPLDAAKAAEYLAYLYGNRFRPASRKKATHTSPIDKARDPEIDAIVKRLYGQDFVCLARA